jgi:hypothetical protein
MTMYLVFSAFTYSPVSLVATTKGSVIFFIVWTRPPNIRITITSLPNPYSVRVKYFVVYFQCHDIQEG